jgi:hypothetical protein
MVEEVNGGDNSTGLANIDLDKRAVHIHGGMEHNLARYVKYYSCGNITLFQTSSQSEVYIKHYGPPKLWESQFREF